VSPSPSWTKVGSGSIIPATESTDENIGADASVVESLGTVTVSGLSNMTTESIGNYLRILNGDNPGYYLISNFLDANTVEIVNPAASGADSANPDIQWEEIFEPTFGRMSDASSTDNTYFKKEYPSVLQSDSGWSLEFRSRVVSYTHGALTPYLASGLNPIRASTGFMVQVLDGTFRTALVFVEAGPPNNKLVLLASYANAHDNLLAIRSKKTDVTGTFYSIDWTKLHLYRLEKTVGGKLRLFVDELITPVIEFNTRDFDFPPHVGGGNPRVEIGHAEAGIQTVSDLQLIKFSISDGFDVSCKPVLSEDELLFRFEHGTNVIVEAEDV